MQVFQDLQQLDQRCRLHAVGLPRAQAAAEDWVGIGFLLLGQPCLARMGQVSEILPVPSSIRVPGVRSWVLGLANVRGNLMPVIDLNEMMGAAAVHRGSKNRVLLLQQDQSFVALLVEEVFGLRRFREEHLNAQENLLELKEWNPIRSGCIQEGEKNWQIVDLHRMSGLDVFLQVN